ncbi:2-dehydro-3-deoxyphosphogluconate aldolase / (4S)-4-hydroxy-2-oxoglutarate aldolase [Alkalibacterium putridalgicola]|uniref:2-dehydro-3-deoxyphosphogluconate aldolase / (4S)-4-hydroxy-2-oxoglutarate aldolase n=1 Tax=Alkalibacterium putridalgicola TaxID=426703 RepID=A0A1H7U2B5_9LACT|nr:bifunctional 2-keto-4-hydroxyglutarate aldolase/2-keto-3-deoxy-6-phosphogluconate aldolase [Alkalibacterium putridalgicola]GEK89501.1 bifunctional 2-keto-4-hydroxyglutarate aldolase/2-keto-3-deoxy-6-phosphogluconate aldolase [Alkalibacterium putridalgicola]SEL90919.1 2-dehydro-3-deoxyphosphogluconate aldolase / (4S)-4-hydroxy-2-oxoglutarate aldolase [Alkalibacterium putridalgicola]
MTKKQGILSQLKENYLFAVIRGKSADDATKISEAVYEGGIKNIEVTFTTPQADESIKTLAKKYADTDMVVGAGTVMDAITARLAIIAGAEFIVSPNFVPEISTVCNTYAVPYLPGCGTVTEVASAMATGVEVVKVFPGGILGPAFIKNVHGPIPHVEMMPSGGVSLDNMDQWMANGAWAVGIGSALTKGLEGNDYSKATENAKAFVDKYNNLK